MNSDLKVSCILLSAFAADNILPTLALSRRLMARHADSATDVTLTAY